MNKISYALGLGIAHQLKSMGIEDFSVEDFSQSVSDVLADKTPAMTNREAQELLNDYFQKKQKEEAIEAFAEYASENVPTSGNMRGSKEYRTLLVKVLTRRAWEAVGGMKNEY